MWCVGKLTEEYVTRMMNILRLYERKYDPLWPVVCLDEKLDIIAGFKHHLKRRQVVSRHDFIEGKSKSLRSCSH